MEYHATNQEVTEDRACPVRGHGENKISGNHGDRNVPMNDRAHPMNVRMHGAKDPIKPKKKAEDYI